MNDEIKVDQREVLDLNIRNQKIWTISKESSIETETN